MLLYIVIFESLEFFFCDRVDKYTSTTFSVPFYLYWSDCA